MFHFSPWLRKVFPGTFRTSRRAVKRMTRPPGLESLEDRLAPAASIVTNRLDYSPGQTAIITGSGYQANEM